MFPSIEGILNKSIWLMFPQMRLVECQNIVSITFKPELCNCCMSQKEKQWQVWTKKICQSCGKGKRLHRIVPSHYCLTSAHPTFLKVSGSSLGTQSCEQHWATIPSPWVIMWKSCRGLKSTQAEGRHYPEPWEGSRGDAEAGEAGLEENTRLEECA